MYHGSQQLSCENLNLNIVSKETFKPKDFDAIAGLFMPQNEDHNSQRIQLQDWFFHDDFSFHPRIKNDIALLKTKRSFDCNLYVQPGEFSPSLCKHNPECFSIFTKGRRNTRARSKMCHFWFRLHGLRA